MKFGFITTIGDDIDVEVTGNYDGPDRYVGYWGCFDVEKVTLLNNDTNLESLLDASTIKKLEERAMNAFIKQNGRI